MGPDSEITSHAFSVAADTAWARTRVHTLKSDDSFAIFSPNGDIRVSTEGFYHRDTRHLSTLTVTLDGLTLRPLSSSVSMDNTMLVCDLACSAPHPDTDMGDEGNEILIRREIFLWRDTRHDTVSLTSWSRQKQRISMRIEFASDFADLFEIRGTRRTRHGRVQPPACDSDGATLACQGLDGAWRWTSLRFETPPERIDDRHAQYTLDLAPGETQRIRLAIRCGTGSETPADGPGRNGGIARFITARGAMRRRRRAHRRMAASLATGNQLADTALRRARDDLVMLTTETAHGPYPYAGVPWFSTAFGRDALITALEVMWLAPSLARGVLAYLAAHQATGTDRVADAEPGKILHETRDGDMARSGEVPFRRYYGSVDSTPLFVMLAGAYLDRTGDIGFVRTLWPHIAAALIWIDRYGDADGDGFVEYGRKAADGLINQGWKDSRDSIFHADGALAQGPIALCEVQAYVFAAKTAAARVAAALGKSQTAATLAGQAAVLRAAFDAAFWDDERGFYILALDGAKRPCRVLASNAGHALFAGIALPERATQIADRLMAPAFFSGWGIRTIAVGEARYNPLSYHNGSVWPHDNALIGLGLARYGRRGDAARLFEAMLATSGCEDRYRLPELFCGLPRLPGKPPTAYPVACAPQAWAAAALPALLQACIGLDFIPGAGKAIATSPVLPPSLTRLRIENLEIGDHRVGLLLSRNADGTVVAEGG